MQLTTSRKYKLIKSEKNFTFKTESFQSNTFSVISEMRVLQYIEGLENIYHNDLDHCLFKILDLILL